MQNSSQLSAGDLGSSELGHPWRGKRLLDLLLSALAIALLSPVLLLIALLIRLDTRGPIFFRQERVGRGERPFTMLKFRTMVNGADSSPHRAYVLSFIENRAETQGEKEGETMFKLANDPRVTRVGHWLRKSSLDELPQFFNVLRGEMSLVGPRPPLLYEVEKYQAWHRTRLQALPGITGWWQVYGRSKVSFDEMVRMDLHYMESQSLWLDLKLICLTIPAILRGRGAR